MKKVIIACFLAILMLITPTIVVAQTSKIPQMINISLINDEIPKILITEDQKNQLINFIEINFEGEEKTQAFDILDNIINTNLEVDLINLSNKLTLYIYEPIPENELYNVTNENELNDLLYNYWGVTEEGFIENLLGSLLIKIIEFIKDRLGWFYDLFNNSISLFYGGITLFVDIIKPMSITIAILFVAVVNKILSAPKIFTDAIKELFQQEYDNFTLTITEFIDQFSGNLINLIDTIISFIENPDIEAYFTELQLFIQWLDEEHWKDPIIIRGSITWLIGIPLANVTVNCRGQSSVTDVNGYFSFLVDSTPDEDSFPKNQYYGMHNCQITISNNNEILKQTPKILSYSFSGGKIDWPFLLIKGKTNDIKTWIPNLEKLNNVFDLIHIFSLNFFRKITIT
jgi:hypothetical protein